MKKNQPAKSTQIARKSTQIPAKVRKLGFLHFCNFGSWPEINPFDGFPTEDLGVEKEIEHFAWLVTYQ